MRGGPARAHDVGDVVGSVRGGPWFFRVVEWKVAAGPLGHLHVGRGWWVLGRTGVFIEAESMDLAGNRFLGLVLEVKFTLGFTAK